MKKTLKEALNTAAKKWAKQEAAGDERVIEAYIKGAKWWMTNARKAIAEYEKDMTAALIDRNGAISPWEKLQIKKTARLWYNRDRLADELDMEESFMRLGQGSTKQLTETIDPRLTLLEKFDRTLTADLTAIGLNYNATPSKIKEDTKRGVSENDTLTNTLAAARDDMNDPKGFMMPEG